MDSIRDFEDMLELLGRHQVKYLIVGGLAFIYHAKPRYTKDMDLWIGFTPDNIDRANQALADFGSSELLSAERDNEILQLGFAPDRIDFLLRIERMSFDDAWSRRVEGAYGAATAYWISLDDLLAIKSAINHPRHQEDARVLQQVKARGQS